MQQLFTTGLEQLTVFNPGRTNLLTRATAETSIDMRSKCAGRILQTPFGHSPHEVKPPTWPIILIPRDHIRRTRLQTQAAMDARQQLLLFTR